MANKKRKRTIIVRTLLLVLMLACGQVFQNFLVRHDLSVYSGVVFAVQFLFCVALTRVNKKSGYMISMIWVGISALNMLASIIVRGEMNAIAGIANLSIYAFTLSMWKMRTDKKDRETVTDILTGLMNRRGIMHVLNDKIMDEEPFSLVFIDFSNFRLVNDNFGHACGDEIMREIAERMKAEAGKNILVSRIGGDEFAFCMRREDDAEEFADRVLARIREKVTLDICGEMTEIYLDAYAGICDYPDDAETADEAIRKADIAMYSAMRNKQLKAERFSAEMEHAMLRAVEVENLTREALQKKYIYMMYQPQYRAGGKVLRGFEALARLKLEDGRMISPGEFIPAAERSNLILQIDDYVLDRTISDFLPIVSDYNSDIVVSVNASAKNMSSKGFADKIIAKLEKAGYPAKNLEIEITEYCLAKSMDTVVENITILRDNGVHIAIDDFGTGYTSLNYLATLPVNLVKLDKSMVDYIEDDEKRLDFIQAVISIGHIMDCEVIAEGVETDGQLELLKDNECDMIQGYVWGRPLMLDDAVEIASR